jgi:hypothetical protein
MLLLLLIIFSFLNMRVLLPEEKLTETSPVEHLALQVWPVEIVQSNCILACRASGPSRLPAEYFNLKERRAQSTFLSHAFYIIILRWMKTQSAIYTGQCSPHRCFVK